MTAASAAAENRVLSRVSGSARPPALKAAASETTAVSSPVLMSTPSYPQYNSSPRRVLPEDAPQWLEDVRRWPGPLVPPEFNIGVRAVAFYLSNFFTLAVVDTCRTCKP